jgi:tetratricopeptide (TPR) repeat protein
MGISIKKFALTVGFISATLFGFTQTAEEYYSRAVEKYTWENYRGAIKDLNNSIILEPTAKAYTLRGLAKMKRTVSDVYSAIKDFDEAIILNGSSIKALTNRGVARLKIGDYEGAESDFSKVIELEPNNVRGYKGRAKARKTLNNLSGANEDEIAAKRIESGVSNPASEGKQESKPDNNSSESMETSTSDLTDSFSGLEVKKTIDIDMRDFAPAQKEINLAGQQLLNARRTFVVGLLLNIGGGILMASTQFTDNQRARVGLGVSGAVATAAGSIVMLTAAIPIGGAGKILRKVEFPRKVSIPVR